jgi:dihydrofolate synthase/folylpolyglutamate synthase
VSAQAVRTGLATVELPGRFQVVAGQPTIVLDVAHNPHAVAALAHNLDQMGFFPRTHAVFGAMRDKDIAAILARMAPLVDAWHFTDLPVARAATAAELATLREQATGRARPVSVAQHASPAEALAAAFADADPVDRIVVFGSFYNVGAVLASGLPQRGGRHSV